jgi:hypothetical protein
MSLADEVVEVGGYGTARQLTLVEDGAPVLPVLTSDRTATGAALLCWLRSRWRIENAFKYASAHDGIDTLRNVRHELDRMRLISLATADGRVAQRSATTAGQKTILTALVLPELTPFFDFIVPSD